MARSRLLTALVLAALGTLLAPAGAGVALPAGPHQYRNPVLPHDFPDPTVIRASNGVYYAYATQHPLPGNALVHIQVARSTDLVHWRYLGEALPHLPAYADELPTSWAPHVVEKDGRFFLFFSTVPDRLADQFGLCLAVATSNSPTGPFRPQDHPLFCGPTLADIDLAVFHDPATGRWLGYWGSGGDIVVRPLAPSLLSMAPHTHLKLLLRGFSAKIRRPFEHGIEGPFVIRHDGWYYLFYSGDNCCSFPPHYAVMVARSRSATGPFTRFGPAHGRLKSVIVHGSARFAGPGHVSVFTDARGHDWLAYHAIDRRHPFLPVGGVRRPMLFDRIVYRDGWPRVRGNEPSNGPRPAPVPR